MKIRNQILYSFGCIFLSLAIICTSLIWLGERVTGNIDGNLLGENDNLGSEDEIITGEQNVEQEEDLTTMDIVSIIDKEGKFTLKSGYSFTKYEKTKRFELFYNKELNLSQTYLKEQLEKLDRDRASALFFLGMKSNEIEPIKIFIFNGNKEDLKDNLQFYRGDSDSTNKYICKNVLFTATIPLSFYDVSEMLIKDYFGIYNMPQWISVGSAIFANEHFGSSGSAANTSKYAIITNLKELDFEKLSVDRKYAKQFSYNLVDYIVRNYGKEKFYDVIKEGSIEKSLNISENQFFKDIKEFAKKHILNDVFSVDSKNYIAEINKNGYFKDDYGFSMDKYATSDHFEIYYSSEQFSSEEEAKTVLGALEENYKDILDTFEVPEEKMPVVKIHLYKNVDNISDLGVKNASGFTYETNRFFMSEISFNKDFYLKNIALHEFIHCVHFTKMNLMYPEFVSNESWLAEGLAQYYSNKFLIEKEPNYENMHYAKSIYFDFVGAKSFLMDDSDTEIFIPDYSDNYPYGYSVVDYILDKKGKEGLMKLIKNVNGFEEIVGMSVKDFSDDWKKYINKYAEN